MGTRECLRSSGRALLLAWLYVWLGSCVDVQDRNVAISFEKNRSAFEAIAKLAISTNLSCEADSGEPQCNNGSARPLFKILYRNAHVMAVQARSDIPQLGNAVYFVMDTYGPITTNSYSKGIVYSTGTLSPRVDNTADHPEMRYRFRTLGGHWYIFVMP